MRWWPFALLILAGAGRWMLAAAWPQTESSLASQAAGCGLAALISVVPMGRSWQGKVRWRPWTVAAAGGALLLCGPATAELLQASRMEPSDTMMALALTPVVVALAGRTNAVAGRLWPGLAAVAGLLLVLAQPSLGDPRSDVALALTPVLTGCGAALLCSAGAESAWRAPSALLGAALVFGLGWVVNARVLGDLVPPSLPATACDGVLGLLSLVTLLRLGAVRWSAQFALVPLLVLVQGIGILRPPLTPRWAAGLVLVALAGVYLLLPQGEDAEPSVVPR